MDYLIIAAILVGGGIAIVTYADSQRPEMNTPAYNESVGVSITEKLSNHVWYVKDTKTDNCFAKYANSLATVDCDTLKNVKVFEFTYSK
jgi:hypothetical protein